MIGRLLRSADFERVLRTRSRASSAHFAVHHLADRPSRARQPVPVLRAVQASGRELSTGAAPFRVEAVDDSALQAPTGLWLGTVVPKRHARRAVTRSLLKRQIHAVVNARASALPGGLWVVRLRAPFDKTRFPSASSEALRTCARVELDDLLNAPALRGASRNALR